MKKIEEGAENAQEGVDKVVEEIHAEASIQVKS